MHISDSPTPYCVTDDRKFGLLLDVDGPISSPVARSIIQPGMIEALVTLANSGVPIAFNTGRGDDFVNREVTEPLFAGGLLPTADVWGIGEKGASWFRLGKDSGISVDANLIVDIDVRNAIREIIADRYSDLVFFDETKRTMISCEQLLSVSSDDFLNRRSAMDREIAQLLLDSGYDISWHGSIPEGFADLATDPAADNGRTNIRLDASIIATDIEHSSTGKDLGAKRFIDLLIANGTTPPQRWFTMGDSRSDYTMADWLHAQHFTVSHVDVRPTEPLPEVEYPVLMHPIHTNDAAGEFFLTAWAKQLS